MQEIDTTWMDTNEAKRLAMEELLDVPGLSKVKNILEKYNLTHVSIDFKLNLTLKKSNQYNPLREKQKND